MTFIKYKRQISEHSHRHLVSVPMNDLFFLLLLSVFFRPPFPHPIPVWQQSRFSSFCNMCVHVCVLHLVSQMALVHSLQYYEHSSALFKIIAKSVRQLFDLSYLQNSSFEMFYWWQLLLHHMLPLTLVSLVYTVSITG